MTNEKLLLKFNIKESGHGFIVGSGKTPPLVGGGSSLPMIFTILMRKSFYHQA